MPKHSSITIFFLLPMILLSNCTERIDLELNEEENVRLVVEAWLTTERKEHTVRLTTTSSYFENQHPPPVLGAKVQISDGTNVFELEEFRWDGTYKTAEDVQGQVGKTYTLSIEYEGEVYMATSTIHRVPKIDSLGYMNVYEYDDEEYDKHHLTLYVQEPKGIGDFYVFKTHVNNQARSLARALLISDEFIDGNYMNGVELKNVGFTIGDEVRLEMLSISEEAHDFLRSILLETEWQNGLFDGPPANVKGNISNGAMGMFITSATSRYTIKIE